MTLPFEEHSTLLRTSQFLYDLMNPKATPRIPKEIRQRARSLLKHYPLPYKIDEMYAGQTFKEYWGSISNDTL